VFTHGVIPDASLRIAGALWREMTRAGMMGYPVNNREKAINLRF
jgi:hypothetical protein